MIVNSFLLFKKLHTDMRRKTLTEIKVKLAPQLLRSADIPDYVTHGRPRSLPTPNCLRGKNRHFLQYNPTPDGRKLFYKRCFVYMKLGTRKETKFQCEKCKMSLCPVPCFKDYHTKTNF